MTRQLTFDPATAAARFTILYAAFAGGVNPQQARGIEILRREGHLMGALHGISEDTDDRDQAGRKVRRWKDGAMTVVLEQAEIELLRVRIETVVWLPEKAAEVVETYDWLGTGVEVENVP